MELYLFCKKLAVIKKFYLHRVNILDFLNKNNAKKVVGCAIAIVLHYNLTHWDE